MAHNLSFDELRGRHSFVNAGSSKPAWHGSGTEFSHRLLTTEEAIEMACLDYEVKKAPLYALIGEKSAYKLENRYTTYRTDTNVLFNANVSDQYHVLQNKEAFGFFDDVLRNDNGYSISTAGALNDGERIFITAKVDNNIVVGKNDEIERYLLMTHGHDGKNNITVMLTPVRVVCNNTLNIALGKNNQRVTIRHTENARERMKTAAQILGMIVAQTQEASDLYNHLAAQPFSDKQLHKFVVDVMLPPAYIGDRQIGKEEFSTRFQNIVDSVMNYALSHPSQQLETTKGTRFGAYNAITGYYQNIYAHKTMETKFDSIFGGTAERNSIKALQLLTR